MGKPASLFRGDAQAGGCAKICLATAAASTSDDIGGFVNSERRSERKVSWMMDVTPRSVAGNCGRIGDEW